ncbi:MAG: type III secretion system chaperone [Planctomycetaceae bacterium]|nr:type III secretion system chaperone [Planctomycetaceae bacterium]
MSNQKRLDALRQELNLGDWEPNSEGIYEIVFDDGLEVQFQSIGDRRLILKSRLEVAPEDPASRESFIRDTLKRSLEKIRRSAGIVTIERSNRTLWLYRQLRTDQLDDAAFFAAIEEFLVTLEWWLQVGQSGPQASLPPDFILRP